MQVYNSNANEVLKFSDSIGHHNHAPIIDLSRFNPADYPIDDEDERMRQERAKEMAEGVELVVLMGDVSIRNDCHAHSQVCPIF